MSPIRRFDAGEPRQAPHFTPASPHDGPTDVARAAGPNEQLLEQAGSAALQTADESSGSRSASRNDAAASPPAEPHALEREVQRALMSHPDVTFSSLVIRRVQNGICLQGVVEADGSLSDAIRLATQVAGVQEVINQLVVRRADVRLKERRSWQPARDH